MRRKTKFNLIQLSNIHRHQGASGRKMRMNMANAIFPDHKIKIDHSQEQPDADLWLQFFK